MSNRHGTVGFELDDGASERLDRWAAAIAAFDKAMPKIRWRRRLRILFTGR